MDRSTARHARGANAARRQARVPTRQTWRPRGLELPPRPDRPGGRVRRLPRQRDRDDRRCRRPSPSVRRPPTLAPSDGRSDAGVRRDACSHDACAHRDAPPRAPSRAPSRTPRPQSTRRAQGRLRGGGKERCGARGVGRRGTAASSGNYPSAPEAQPVQSGNSRSRIGGLSPRIRRR